MDIPIQKLFTVEDRKKYFGDNYDDFCFKGLTESETDTCDVGKICRQSRGAGTTVLSNTTLTIYVGTENNNDVEPEEEDLGDLD